MSAEDEIRNERIAKIDKLRQAGMEAYPAHTGTSETVQTFLARFEHAVADQKLTILAGRIMAKRGQGGIIFVDIFDGSTSLATGGTARVQAVFQKSEMDEARFALFADTADSGDFVRVTGLAYLTKRGEQSVLVKEWTMLAKSLLPIPTEHFGIQDAELKLRERYLDILLDPELRAMFERRSKFWQTVRNFYLAHDFLEVESPVLENTPGGADARPFVTHHNALDIDVYMRIALELWHKRLLVAGFPRVFEIGRVFRNEGQSREHLQDFTFLESYQAFSDMQEGMQFTKELYQKIVKDVYGKYTFTINNHEVDFADEWKELNFCDLIREKFGIDPLNCTEAEAIQAVRDAQIQVGEALNLPRAIDHLWKSIRKGIAGPAFLVGIPVYLEPLAKRAADPRVVERVQILIAGSEVGKGFSELNDPLDQRARFEEQQSMRDKGDDEAQRLDEDYVRAMEYGMPPSFGFGFSERLFSFLENRPAHETQLFPLLRPRTQV